METAETGELPLRAGDRVSIPPQANAAMYATEGTVVGVVPMETGWTCVSVVVDDGDAADPWIFSADDLAGCRIGDGQGRAGGVLMAAKPDAQTRLAAALAVRRSVLDPAVEEAEFGATDGALSGEERSQARAELALLARCSAVCAREIAAELRELLRGAEADEDHLVGTGGDNAAWCEGVLGGLRRALSAVEGTHD